MLSGQTVIFNPLSGPLSTTLQDNVAYEIGTTGSGVNQKTLADGATMDIPRGVTVMVDAGAVFKLQGANISVGSVSQNIDHSLGALQVLGTPQESVYFTSYLNETIGNDTDLLRTTASKGDWGGLVFRNDLDYAVAVQDPSRSVLETAGVFLDYVNHADLSYGGGNVNVGSVTSAYAPIYMAEARPTISYNTISHSADAALSADPDSFQESEFRSTMDTASPDKMYTADYNRVGPDVHGNHLADNSVNGLFVRIRIASNGASLDTLNVASRFDDPDMSTSSPKTWSSPRRRAARSKCSAPAS